MPTGRRGQTVTRYYQQRVQRLLLLYIPAGVFMLVALIYYHGAAREIPVSVLDLDQTPLSRLLIRSLNATGGINVAGEAEHINQLHNVLFTQRYAALYVLPRGLEAGVQHGRQVVITCYRNSVNPITANVLNSEGSAAIKTISAGIVLQQARAKAAAEQQAYAMANPLTLQAAPLYNPCYNYQFFMLMPLFFAMYHMAAMLAGALFAFGNKSGGGLFTAQAVAAATAAAVVLLLSAAGALLFKQSAPPLSLSSVLLPCGSLLACYAVGQGIGTLAATQMFAAEASVFISTPAFIFSGYTFPVEAMPLLHQVISAISPFTWFMRAYLSLPVMRLPLGHAALPIAVLALFYLAGTLLTLKAQAKPPNAGLVV